MRKHRARTLLLFDTCSAKIWSSFDHFLTKGWHSSWTRFVTAISSRQKGCHGFKVYTFPASLGFVFYTASWINLIQGANAEVWSSTEHFWRSDGHLSWTHLWLRFSPRQKGCHETLNKYTFPTSLVSVLHRFGIPYIEPCLVWSSIDHFWRRDAFKLDSFVTAMFATKRMPQVWSSNDHFWLRDGHLSWTHLWLQFFDCHETLNKVCFPGFFGLQFLQCAINIMNE
jgi:hypothetical protein